MSNKYKTRIIYTNFVCDMLIVNGEKFLYTRQDLKYPDRNVFVFENSDTFDSNLEAAIKAQLESQGKVVL